MRAPLDKQLMNRFPQKPDGSFQSGGNLTSYSRTIWGCWGREDGVGGIVRVEKDVSEPRAGHRETDCSCSRSFSLYKTFADPGETDEPNV